MQQYKTKAFKVKKRIESKENKKNSIVHLE